MAIKEKEVQVLTFDEIILNRKGVDKAEEVLNRYKTTEVQPKSFRDPVVHLYFKSDTYNNSGELTGYQDCLFFDIHIFDTVSNIKYVSEHHDGITFNEAAPQNTSIFKDGSTILNFKGEYTFRFDQDVKMSLVKEVERKQSAESVLDLLKSSGISNAQLKDVVNKIKLKTDNNPVILGSISNYYNK